MKKITLFAASLLLVLAYSGKAQIITTVAGDGTQGYTGDGGAATSAALYTPVNVSFDGAGNFYISDVVENVVREVNGTTGIITTVAGNNVSGYSGDGGLATSAEISEPGGPAFDKAGNMYIADFGNNRIRKVTKSTGIISTIGGNGTGGYNGDGISALSAEINEPNNLVLDASGNVYFTDSKNNRIREINVSNGNIYTITGNGTAGFSGDGGIATSAEINYPNGIDIDASGSIYFDDQNNNRIRKIDHATGNISTVAGDGVNGYSGDGALATSAELNLPVGLKVDASGDIFISDTRNNVIRKVAAYNGFIYTIVGTGTGGFSGDGGIATSAELNVNCGITISPAGDLYIADWSNSRVRKVTAPLAVNEISDNSNIAVYPSPANQELTIICKAFAGNATIKLIDVLGNEILSQSIASGQNSAQVDISGLSTGIYFVKVTSDRYSYVTKIIKK